MITSLFRVLHYFMSHPIGRLNRLGTLVRILRWQIGSRTLDAPAVMPFVDDLRLIVQRGMHGATGNIYVGLMEFEDMSFVLHLLRHGDEFIDVGANVGVYSLLAASRGAKVLAIEPVPTTYDELLDNISVNYFQNWVYAENMGVGGTHGKMLFSTKSGAKNHVLTKDESLCGAIPVKTNTLDQIALNREPTMIKIDVEGFEIEVIKGANKILSSNSLIAVLIEMNGSGARYGFNENDIHSKLLEFDFRPARYYPFKRSMVALEGRQRCGNTLYVRSWQVAAKRLKSSKPYVWAEMSI